MPGLLDQIIRCKDSISQEYLLECIISVFPDDFHLQTLNLLLSNCKELHEKVAVRKIIISLVERLVKYSKNNDSTGIPEDIKIFEIFSKEVP
ncbi:hypothetical protein, partial [Salmonella sp. s51228]|uniref:hypothetical protein n=1 Tax=Salmonella sp. s51228 TaxID=3159652 RepID=UPI00397EB3CC